MNVFRTLVLLPFLFIQPVGATSFYIPPFPQTVQQSPVMVRGRVGASHSDWGKGSDGSKRLYTFYDLQVEEVLKGSAPSDGLTMREMGGEKDGIGMEIPGSSHFSPGEEVVVTLSPPNPDGTFDIRGLMMGKLSVKKDDAGDEVLEGPALHPPGEARKVWTVDALRQLIQSQGGAALPIASSPSPQPSKSPSPLAPRLLPTPSVAASQALSSPQPDEDAGRGLWLRAVLAIFAISAVLWILMRTRK